MESHMAKSNSRIDRIVGDLNKLHGEAHDIFNARVDVLLCDLPRGTSFGETKREMLEPAGLALDYIKALDMLRST